MNNTTATSSDVNANAGSENPEIIFNLFINRLMGPNKQTNPSKYFAKNIFNFIFVLFINI